MGCTFNYDVLLLDSATMLSKITMKNVNIIMGLCTKKKKFLSFEIIRKFMLNQKIEDAYFEVNPKIEFDLQ